MVLLKCSSCKGIWPSDKLEKTGTMPLRCGRCGIHQRYGKFEIVKKGY
jgi:DNA-directed RNA polymerase subunit RPC12/RpoP